MVVDHICVNFGTRLYQELLLALQNHNIEQHVFYPRNENNLITNAESPFQVDSPQVLNCMTKISFLRKRRIMQQQYDPLFHRNKPDIIHAHTLFSDGSLANYYNRKYDIPFIVAIRSTDIDAFLKYKPWLKRYGKHILDNASYIIFISHSLKKKFLQKYGTLYESKSLIIPNGISQSFFSVNNLQKRGVHAPLKLVYVGDFRKLKNVPTLIKYVNKRQARLTIVGRGGDQEKRVLQMIRNSNKINYLGRIENQSKLTEIYGQSDVFIMISKRETFGLVYIEAMSQGLPVIYSNGVGIDGLFNDGEVGFGVDPNSSDDIDTATRKIIADYENISKNCLNQAKEFNWSNISNRYYHVYTKSLL